MSLRAFARRAGVSAMAPYRHYPDKEALLAAVAVQGFDGLRAAPGQALVAQALAYVGYALENPALFRLMFGPRRLGIHPGLTAASETAYAVLARRVAAEVPSGANREARALGCWLLVHGLASLFLDGRVGDKMTAADGDVVRRVAQAMLAAGSGPDMDRVGRDPDEGESTQPSRAGDRRSVAGSETSRDSRGAAPWRVKRRRATHAPA